MSFGKYNIGDEIEVSYDINYYIITEKIKKSKVYGKLKATIIDKFKLNSENCYLININSDLDIRHWNKNSVSVFLFSKKTIKIINKYPNGKFWMLFDDGCILNSLKSKCTCKYSK